EPESGADPDIYDVSPNTFTIQGSITIDSPTAEEDWPTGYEHTIEWTLNCGCDANTKVDIYYSLDNGGEWTEIAADQDADNVTANSEGSYPWTPAIGESSDLGVIKVVKDGDTATYGTQNFDLTSSLTVDQPTSGTEILQALTPYLIKWTIGGGAGAIDDINIYYHTSFSTSTGSTDPGWNICNPPTGGERVDATTGGTGFTWNVPDAIGTDLGIMIKDPDAPGTYDWSGTGLTKAYFKIKGWMDLYQPAQDAVVDTSGITADLYIRWTNKGTLSGAEDYTIYYSKDGGSTWPVTVAETSATDFAIGDGEYLWDPADTDVTNLDEDDSAFKIEMNSDTDVAGTSGTCTFRGSLSNLQMDGQGGGGTYTYGDEIVFTWNAFPEGSGELGTVELRYSTDGGQNYNTTFHTLDASAETYTWTHNDDNCLGDQIRFQVRLATDSTSLVRASTTPNTKIYGNISMVSPTENGGDSRLTWEIAADAGDPTIQWDYTGSMSAVSLYYSKDGTQGGATNEIATGLTAADKSYDWPLPIDGSVFKTGDDGKNDDIIIKVVNDAYPDDVKAFSAQPVTIKSRIMNVTPSGTTIYVGTPTPHIGWSTKGDVPNVKIKYSTDGGAGNWTYVTPSAITNADGYDLWAKINCPLTQPYGAAANQIVFCVESSVHASDITASGSEVTVKGMLEITDPTNANISDPNDQALVATDTYRIEWKVNNDVGGSGGYDLGDLELYYANGAVYDGTAFHTASSSGDTYYDWTVPDDVGAPLKKIKIEDINESTEVFDESEQFEIRGMLYAEDPPGTVQEHWLENPNGGEPYYIGTVGSPNYIDVQWRYKGTMGNVDIYVDNASGAQTPTAYPTHLATVAYNYGEASGICHYDQVALPGDIDLAGTTYRIKVESVDDPDYTYANSQADFVVKGDITLVDPGISTGQIWYVDGDTVHATHGLASVSWTTTGGLSEVDILLDTDGDLDFDDYTIKSNYTGASPFDWAKDSVKGLYTASEGDRQTVTSDTCRVRVRDSNDPTVYDESTQVFFMKPLVFLGSEITSGTTWKVGLDGEQFTWTTTGTVSNLRIYNSDDGGDNWYEVENSIAASAGAYTWESIPGTNTVSNGQAVIKLERLQGATPDTEVSDESTWFSVKGRILVESPTTNQTYNVQGSGTIEWTCTGDVGNVDIQYNTGSGWTTITGASGIASNYCDPAGIGEPYTFTVPGVTAPSVSLRVKEAALPNAIGPDSDYSDPDPTHKFLGNIIFDQGTTNSKILEMGTSDVPHRLSWSNVGTFDGINIYYKEKDGPTWIQISTTMAGSPATTDAAHDYDPTDSEITLLDDTNEILFKVTDANDESNVYAETPTNEANTILGYLELQGPVTPVEYTVGETPTLDDEKVKWIKYGDIGSLKFELWAPPSPGAPAEWLNYAAGSGLSDSHGSGNSDQTNYHSPDWTIPDRIYDQCKIRVSTIDASYPTLTDEHTVTFTIKGDIDEIIEPVGDTPGPRTIWYVGQSHDITWNAIGTMTEVNIDLYTPSGGWQNIVSNYDNTPTGLSSGPNTYTWTWADTGLQKQKTNQCKIRVVSVQNNDVLLASDEFSFIPQVTVTTPSQDLIAYTNPTVEWTCSAVSKTTNVDIYVDLDGDLDWADAECVLLDDGGGSGVPVGNGTAGHTTTSKLPTTLASGARLMVRDHSTSYVYGYTAPFNIIGRITIDKPDDTITNWKIGDTNRLIEWYVEGDVGDMKIYADYDGDGVIEPVDGDGVLHTMAATAGTNAYHSWTWEDPDAEVDGIGDYAGNNVKIEIRDADAEGVTTGVSEAFSIIGGFTFVYPVNTDVFQIINNTPQMAIQWQTLGDSISAVQIRYYNEDDTAWYTLGTDISNPNHGATPNSYTWDTTHGTYPLPLDLASDKLKFEITATTPNLPATVLVSDEFIICGKLTITAPLADDTWLADDGDNTISWDTYGPVTGVKIWYTRDSGGTWVEIVNSTPPEDGDADPNEGSDTWAVPMDPSLGDYITRYNSGHRSQIKIEDADARFDQDVTHTSGDFKVKGVLTLVAPTQGTLDAGLDCDSLQSITLKRDGRIDTVNLRYSTNSGSSYISTPIETYQFPNDTVQQVTRTDIWQVPETPVNTTYRLMVEDANYVKSGTDGTYVVNASDFRVIGELALTAPLGTGLTWKTNESPHTMTWNVVHGNINLVKVVASTKGTFDGLAGDVTYDIATAIDPFNNETFHATSYGTRVGSGTHNLVIPIDTTFEDTYKFKVVQDHATFKDDVISAATETIKVRGNIAVQTPTTGNDYDTSSVAWRVDESDKQVKFTVWGENAGTVYVYLYDGEAETDLVPGGLTAVGDGNVETYGNSVGGVTFDVPDVKSHSCTIRVRDNVSAASATIEGESSTFSTYPTISNIAITPTDPPNMSNLWMI
ncbi:hypothetical protein ACFL2G_04990, partial [Candidatus Omnitrophota bacterium]